ncbi:MAG: YdcF family protein [Coleofasciculus sp. Co-bin14]|nr:YdcF family protein [Coleofasciculus sp. Co-bin14]MBD0390059.1 YdcF family protein [Nostoc sp. C3-bin3]
MRLIQRQEMLIPTIQGGLVTFLVVVLLIVFMLTHIHPFLAANSPIQANILVVEGWMKDYAIKDAMNEFEKGGYQKLITTGLPVDLGYYLLSQYKTTAELSAATLIALGFDQDKLVAVPGPKVVKNRTAASAAALRQWIATSNLKVTSINLYTYDVHARRSWLIFQQSLAPDIKVGVIAVQSISYDPKRWWMSSEGVRSVLDEAIAYIYARLVDWRA